MQRKFFMPKLARRTLWILALLYLPFAVAAAAPAAQACSALQVDQAWLRVVPGAPVSAGYFTMANTGDAAVTLLAVSSPQFGRAHMHESLVDADGMATMQPVDAVTIEPDATVAFAPGSYHVMLFQPQTQLAAGDAVTLQLQLQCGGAAVQREVTAVVRDTMGAGSQHQGMKHGDMDMDMHGNGNGGDSHSHMQHGD